MFLGKVPCFASGASLLSFSLMGLVLIFHSVGTSLMRILDSFFFQAMLLSFPEYLFDLA